MEDLETSGLGHGCSHPFSQNSLPIQLNLS
jgi:hypothetical protein